MTRKFYIYVFLSFVGYPVSILASYNEVHGFLTPYLIFSGPFAAMAILEGLPQKKWMSIGVYLTGAVLLNYIYTILAYKEPANVLGFTVTTSILQIAVFLVSIVVLSLNVPKVKK